jgi:hypothetical protein
MAYTKKQAAAKPGLQRIRDKKKNTGGGLTRLDKPGKPAESIGKKRKPGSGSGPVKKRDDRFKIQPVTRPKPRGR